jgi:DNA-binding NarL/FixJ family response regulator
MQRVRVMLVEDDAFTRTTMKAALQLQGIEIVHDTASVASAMKVASVIKPDAAVLDLDLGNGPTGIDLALGLRRILPKIGIVLLTGFYDPRFLNPRIAKLPSGSRYLVKRDIHEIEKLHHEILQSINLLSKQAPEATIPLSESIPNAQLETLRLLALGLSNSEIAKSRNVSEKSVEQAISRLVNHFKIDDSQVNKRVELSRLYFHSTGSVPAENQRPL